MSHTWKIKFSLQLKQAVNRQPGFRLGGPVEQDFEWTNKKIKNCSNYLILWNFFNCFNNPETCSKKCFLYHRDPMEIILKNILVQKRFPPFKNVFRSSHLPSKNQTKKIFLGYPKITLDSLKCIRICKEILGIHGEKMFSLSPFIMVVLILPTTRQKKRWQSVKSKKTLCPIVFKVLSVQNIQK